jgi:hypothetical protein
MNARAVVILLLVIAALLAIPYAQHYSASHGQTVDMGSAQCRAAVANGDFC